MAMDKTLLCKTTGWHNNCGLNCLSHFLYEKLQNGELQRTFTSHPAYNELLKTFAEYYQFSSQPTWDEVVQLLSAYPNPIDREAVFAPVLRQHLGKVLLKKSAAVWETEAAAAISDYLKTGEAHDIAEPLIRPNLEYLRTLKIQYDRGVSRVENQKLNEQEIALAKTQLATAIPPREATNDSLRLQILFQRKNDLEDALNAEAKEYWMNEGMQRYAQHMADLNQSVMISADQLSLLGQELEIGVELYTPDSMPRAQNVSEGDFRWQMKVYNAGAHWEYEEPNHNATQVSAHNRYYDNASLGEFKIFGPQEESQEELIPAYINSQWDHIKASKKEASISPTVTSPTVTSPTVTSPSPTVTSPTVILPTATSPTATQRAASVKQPFVSPNVDFTKIFSQSKNLGQHLFSGLKNYIENKRAQLLEFRYKKLHLQQEFAMDHLLNKLHKAVRKGTINEVEKQVIFEFYFNVIEEEMNKGPVKQLNQRRLESIIKEIKRLDIVSIKRFALEEGKTYYDMRLEQKRKSLDDLNPSPTKKRRM